jgi:putative ABC transport system permease protein
VLAAALASEHHLRVGDAVTLPAPLPISVRVAALSTNIGWAPGAIVMNAQDYARAWASMDASAYNVLLLPGATRQALPSDSGLTVQTASAHAAEQND